MARLVIGVLVSIAFLVSLLLATRTEAIPTFARKYKTSCSTCHYAYPRLNNFGKAFRNNGLRYPGDDKDFAKEEAVSLGSEGQKKAFPDAIWPADIPGLPVISFRWISRMHYEPSKKGEEFKFENPHELEAFMAGTIGEDLSFFFELEWEHAGEFGYGGFLDYKFSDPFHVRLGNLEPAPIRDGERLTREHYNYGSFLDIDASGMEFWGAVNGAGDKGGFVYAAGLFNGENDGEDNVDLNAAKDVFAKVSYKIGGMGVLSSTTASQTSAFWRDNSLTIGGFGHGGKNDDWSKNRNFGGNLDVFYEDLNVFGLYMVSQVKAPDTTGWVDTKRAFVEADYVVFPWLIPLARFEYTEPEGGPVKRQVVPAIVVMARANVKLIPTARLDLKDSDVNRYNLQIEVGF
ncbi:MAG TPA: hypothetical protein VN285_07640 [Candidatus Deferrimicrobium sp.]|nr:hypothetical protein [Candidatus Deferrimicrobium sp.]